MKVGKPKKSGSKLTTLRPIEPAKQVEIVLLEAALSAQVARAEAAEGERDRWRQMADKLADKLAERPVRRWWPF